MHKILLTGATGTVGRELVRLLLERGVPVRVLVRRPRLAAAALGPKVEIHYGDLSQPATLPGAVEGAVKVFLLTPSSPEQVTLETNLVAAAVKAGTVRHLVKLSSLGAAEDSRVAMSRWHWQVEKRIEETGLPFTFLRPHNFMQNLLDFAPEIRAQRVFRAPMKSGKMSMVDARDVAAVAAVALTQGGHEGKVHRITGPERLSFAEAAERISQAIRRQVTYQNITEEAAREDMARAGWPQWLIEDQLELYRFFSAGRSMLLTDTVARVTGQPAIPFARFAKDYRVYFK
ncbi:MAG: SDR family oxidoreductase [Candidatus Zixiibacteriota bacterium]|nr:MAG: SDR family oxidoreductase [candidate division Zixibacteria bacterium]